jgi:hypothetical protein
VAIAVTVFEAQHVLLLLRPRRMSCCYCCCHASNRRTSTALQRRSSDEHAIASASKHARLAMQGATSVTIKLV